MKDKEEQICELKYITDNIEFKHEIGTVVEEDKPDLTNVQKHMNKDMEKYINSKQTKEKTLATKLVTSLTNFFEYFLEIEMQVTDKSYLTLGQTIFKVFNVCENTIGKVSATETQHQKNLDLLTKLKDQGMKFCHLRNEVIHYSTENEITRKQVMEDEQKDEQ